MARSWKSVAPEGSKVHVGAPHRMTYDGRDMSEVGIVQHVYGTTASNVRGTRWLLQPLPLSENDVIIVVEADMAFYDMMRPFEINPNQILYPIDSNGIPIPCGCAYSVWNATDYNLFFSTLRGLVLGRQFAHMADRHLIYKRIFGNDALKFIKNIQPTSYSTDDEHIFGDCVHILHELYGMKFNHIPWEWYGIAPKDSRLWSMDFQEMSRFKDHVDFGKSTYPNARLVHLFDAERMYLGRERGEYHQN